MHNHIGRCFSSTGFMHWWKTSYWSNILWLGINVHRIYRCCSPRECTNVDLLSNKLGNRVHLMYLPQLAYLDRASRYSWDFTCLAHLYKEICRVIYPTSKKWEDVQCCYSLRHGIACHSFNQMLSVNRHIHLHLGKQKFLTQTKSIIFGNVFDTNILHFTRWNGKGIRFSRISRGIGQDCWIKWPQNN